MAGRVGAFGIVHEPEVHDLDPGPGKLAGDATDIALEPFLEAGELRPVRVKADAEQSNAQGRGAHDEPVSHIGTCRSRPLAVYV